MCWTPRRRRLQHHTGRRALRIRNRLGLLRTLGTGELSADAGLRAEGEIHPRASVLIAAERAGGCFRRSPDVHTVAARWSVLFGMVATFALCAADAQKGGCPLLDPSRRPLPPLVWPATSNRTARAITSSTCRTFQHEVWTFARRRRSRAEGSGCPEAKCVARRATMRCRPGRITWRCQRAPALFARSICAIV
jgi:hypothetical protein